MVTLLCGRVLSERALRLLLVHMILLLVGFSSLPRNYFQSSYPSRGCRSRKIGVCKEGIGVKKSSGSPLLLQKLVLCVPFLHGWWGSCGAADPRKCLRGYAANASSGAQSEAPRWSTCWLNAGGLQGADFWEGDEDSDFSFCRVLRFFEWPGPLHCIAFPLKILTKPPHSLNASPFFTEDPLFHLSVFVASPSQKSAPVDFF